MDPLRNPYAPPLSAPVSPRDAPDPTLEDATTTRRLVNFLVDSFARGMFAAFVRMASELLLHVELPTGLAVRLVSSLVSMFVYYVFLEGLFGLTLGKLVTGTRVVGLDGRRPALGALLVRTATRFVPFEPFSFVGDRPRGWHDRWSGTRVVRVRGRAASSA